MTTTTGMPSVAAFAETVEMTARARLVPAAARWSRVPWLLVGADVAASSLVITLGATAFPTLSTTALLAALVGWPVLVAVCGGYPSAAGSAHTVRAGALARAAGALAVMAWTVAAVAPDLAQRQLDATPRSALLLVTLPSALSIGLRLVVNRLGVTVPRRVVLAGDAAGVRRLLAETHRTAASGAQALVPVAVCLHGQDPLDTSEVAALSEGLTVWFGADDLSEVVRAHSADAVVVAPGPAIGHAELRRWGAWLQDCGAELLVSSGLRDVASRRLGASALGGLHLLRVRPAAITGASHLLKAAFDRVAAVLLLAAFAPLLLTLALLVRRDSPGPALFTQTRVGRRGRLFTVYKLRTMCTDADRLVDQLAEVNESDRDGVLFKIRQDPRITRLGAMLRKYSLDELPQLINVARGEMSLIGPRPALPSEVGAYDDDLRRRLVVKPGLTGLWQVSGRSDLSWEETVRLDLRYVDNWSWSLDMAIAARTVGAVLGHKGAY